MKRLLVAAFMLLSIVALNLPVSHTADASTIVAPDFCSDCEWNCAVDSWFLYERCLDDRGDTPQNQTACYNEWGVNYYNSCTATFCNANGCSVKKKAPRSAPGATD